MSSSAENEAIDREAQNHRSSLVASVWVERESWLRDTNNKQS